MILPQADAHQLPQVADIPQRSDAGDRLISFDADRAFAHVRAFCYPRRVGTAEERQAAQAIADEFETLDLAVQREPFSLSLAVTEIGSTIVFLLCAALVLASASLAGAYPLIAAIGWLMAMLIVRKPWRLAHFLGRKWGKACESENVIASLTDWNREPAARVVFMAHYDTKSQVLPTGIRVACVMAATILCGLLSLSALAAAIGFPIALSLAMVPGTAIAVLLLAILGANFTGNRSPGAVDNGSAVGTLLELARSWRPSADAPVDMVWVASGAEEVGLNGAHAFLEKHGGWWEEKPTLLINLESVGAGPQLYLAGERRALRLAEDVARELGLACSELHILGAGMDHEPFAARGLASLSILGDVVRKSLHLHSSRDNLNLVDIDAMSRAGRLAARLAQRWARIHQ